MLWYIVAAIPLILLLRRLLRRKVLSKLDLDPPVVQTKNGKVSGEWGVSSNERKIASFKGIPYAKPPVGKLRFLRPEPVENWNGVKKCIKSTEFCQINVFQSGNPRAGKEDSLVVNIYSPDLKGKLPVMVFIHGGAFNSGSNSTKLYGPEYLLNKDVVLVAINYRLGVLGFLYLDGEKVCGNQGMRDQVLAMRWVKENIESFGGNSENITIFGESAGGMSVMNHIVSPMSAGLFNAAIVQSGSPKSPYCCLNKHPAHYAYSIAEHLGIDKSLPVDQIIEKLQNMDPFKIQEKVGVLEEFVRAPVYCKPIVDGGLVEDPFLPEEPMELIKKGKFNKVPVIMGANEHEGLLIKAFYEKDGVKFEEAWQNFGTIGPLAFFATEKCEVSEEESKLCMEYRNKHFGTTKFCSDAKSTEKFVQMYGDFLFVAPCYLAACEMSQHVPVFLYSYNFQGSLSLYPVVSLPPSKLGLHFFLKLTFGLDVMVKSKGVCHADELFLLFKPSMIPTEYMKTPGEKGVSDELVELWTSFATHKHPTPSTKKWKEFSVEDSEYYEISSSSGMMNNSGYKERMEEWRIMWEKVPTTFRRLSSPTWSEYPGLLHYPIPGTQETPEPHQLDLDESTDQTTGDMKEESSESSSESEVEDEQVIAFDESATVYGVAAVNESVTVNESITVNESVTVNKSVAVNESVTVNQTVSLNETISESTAVKETEEAYEDAIKFGGKKETIDNIENSSDEEAIKFGGENETEDYIENSSDEESSDVKQSVDDDSSGSSSSSEEEHDEGAIKFGGKKETEGDIENSSDEEASAEETVDTTSDKTDTSSFEEIIHVVSSNADEIVGSDSEC